MSLTRREWIVLACVAERCELPRELAADLAFAMARRDLLTWVHTKDCWQLTEAGKAAIDRREG